MAVYTLINKSQLQSLLAYYDLGELVDFTPIQAGTTNSNYEVITELDKNKQSKFVLTIVEQDLSKSDLDFCLEFAKELDNHGVPAVAAIKDRSGASFRKFFDKSVLITEYKSGKSLTNQNLAENSECCTQLGKVLANMHIVGHQLKIKRPNPAGLDWCLDVENKLKSYIPLDLVDVIREETKYLAENQSIIEQIEHGQGAVHTDLFCDNLLFQNDKLQGIIDFYYACTDYFLYDLAIAVNDWVIDFNGQLNQSGYDILIKSYLSTLSQNKEIYTGLKKALKKNNELWPYMLRKAALRFWLLRLQAKYIPKEANIKTEKDPDEYELKLLFHRSKNFEVF